MSCEDIFCACVREIGQKVEVWRDGILLGRGYAHIQPVFDRGDQFQPTDLGLHRRETQICYGEPGLPLEPSPGETLVKAGKDIFRVISSHEGKVGEGRIFWRAYLEWREEDEA